MLRLAAASLRLALPLYLTNLVLALVPAGLLAGGLAAAAGTRPWVATLLGGDWANRLIELSVAMRSPLGPAPDERFALAGVFGALGVLMLPAMLLAQGVAYAFLSGGILERLRATGATGPMVVGPVPFWRGCRRWFGPFVALVLVGTLAFVVLVGVAAVLTGLVQGAVGSVAAGVLGAILLSAINGWLELARADMVRQQYRSAPRALLRAARLIAFPRVFPRAVGVWTLAAVLSVALLALNAAAVRPTDTVTWVTVVQALVLGQAVAFLGAWLKVGRLAAALTLDRPATTHVPVEIEAPAEDAAEFAEVAQGHA